MPAGLQFAQGDIALTLTAQGAATVKSGGVGASGSAACVLVLVHCTAITGTTPTLDVSLEESTNGETGWTAVAASSTPQVTAAGNFVAFAVPAKNFVRVSATVGGTTPSVTARVAILAFAD
jgi:hypothetical protein